MKRNSRSTSATEKKNVIFQKNIKEESNSESNDEEIEDENDSGNDEIDNDADNEDDDSEDDSEDDKVDHNSQNDEEDNLGDGFGNVMQKILNQNVGSKVPVLSKRKTTAMKKLTEDLESKREVKKIRMQRLAEKGKQEIVPNIISNDRERHLKRIATRGVVALFNAISKAKRDDININDSPSHKKQNKSGKGDDGSAAEISGQEIKRMTQENFLAMLKKGEGTKEEEQLETNPNNNTSNGRTIEMKKDSDSDSDSNDESEKESEKGGKGWKVFNQDLYTDATLNKVSSTSLKGWDREDSDSADSEDEERLPDPFEEALEEKREEGLSKKKRIQNLKAKAKKAKGSRA